MCISLVSSRPWGWAPLCMFLYRMSYYWWERLSSQWPMQTSPLVGRSGVGPHARCRHSSRTTMTRADGRILAAAAAAVDDDASRAKLDNGRSSRGSSCFSAVIFFISKRSEEAPVHSPHSVCGLWSKVRGWIGEGYACPSLGLKPRRRSNGTSLRWMCTVYTCMAMKACNLSAMALASLWLG